MKADSLSLTRTPPNPTNSPSFEAFAACSATSASILRYASTSADDPKGRFGEACDMTGCDRCETDAFANSRRSGNVCIYDERPAEIDPLRPLGRERPDIQPRSTRCFRLL